MLISETRLVVRYAETDRMGIVHHSNYPIWFEAGRTDFIKKLGISYSYIEEKGIFLPLIELKCFYKGAAKYEDEIKVLTRLKKLTYSRIIFHYEILKNMEIKPITAGETIHVWTNTNLKPINIYKHFPDIYKLLSDAL
ncbi:MAG: acyl-CoA thioesterase [Firmicutes bacterium]|nr:acyl-CoA thioesterase [Bacillota bacterium]